MVRELENSSGENGVVLRRRNELHGAHRIFAIYIVVASILLVLIFMIFGIVAWLGPQELPPRLKAYRDQVPKERVDEYESCQEETVESFEDHNIGAAIIGSGPQAHARLPLILDVTKAREPGGSRSLGEDDLWNGMQVMVANQKCMDTRMLLCQLLLDGMCDCANSSVDLLVGTIPNKIKVHCDPGDMLRLVHSSTYDYAGITRHSDAEKMAHTNRGEKTPEPGMFRVVEKGDNLGVAGLDVNVAAKIQAIPTIDLQIARDSVKASAVGSVMATINFTVETQRPIWVQGSDIIHVPNPAVVKQRCVAFFCFGMMFQAAVRLSFIAERRARVKGSVSAEFNFAAGAEAFLDGAADPWYEAAVSDINYWSDIPFAPFLGRQMQFNLSVVPMITIFSVPGIPMTFINRIKWEINGSRDHGEPPVRRAGVNIHTEQYFDSFGLPSALLVDWSRIEKGLNMALHAFRVHVPKALQALAAGCNVTFPAASLSAIKTVTESSTKTVRLMVPNSLKKAFPKKTRDHGPRFCWTVGKMCNEPMADPKCTADTLLYCPSRQSGRPSAIPMKTMHIHPSGAVSFKIKLDCDFDTLKQKNRGKLYQTMQDKLKQTIAFEAVAGSAEGLSTDDVHLVPVSGQHGVLEVTITPKDEVASSEILKQFSHPKQVQQALTKNLGLSPGIKHACLDSAVSNISTPMVKVCPQSFCPSGNLKMRSHGKHSFCHARGGKQFGQLQQKYFTLESCQEACLKDASCYGVEYEYMRGVKNCELWRQPIHFCSVVPPSRDVDDMTSFFECYSKCDRANTPAGRSTSFPLLTQ